MYFPERSDPIGLSLASCSLTTRKETTEDAIADLNDEALTIKSILTHQKQLNEDLSNIIELMQQRLGNKDEEFIEHIALTPREQNKKLRQELQIFVNDTLALDLMDSNEVSLDTIKLQSKDIINRLIEYDDTLEVEHFQPYCKRLYRLLVKSCVVNLRKDLEGRDIIKLLDFDDDKL
ncbi:hypothetical protein Kpol_1024p6 [Vanderwaltozyma polyspora DSM 70294]|uniref:Uncharacterized protein n=1 Tax=Vanderwaltozyma polyspora (strain ATCC 22028 / DSM 70294 / BCRC 21397 / CBS 2163 / NBRC 10782 / NRRL Y-8283 / UCD 57-17) TaxID=436907 RepID=A7TLG7_VANPO|nr:uncharacterized protein Kpol_1024p6 [Vanderwaltozyma polyspora DSM 70294]EDO16853.1 hypothetical protein Kpol_1024p6 [Vanderwaltozyma polyspora DSM 70294]